MKRGVAKHHFLPMFAVCCAVLFAGHRLLAQDDPFYGDVPSVDVTDDEASLSPEEKYRPAVGSRIVERRKDTYVGDPVELRVTVIHEKDVRVNLPAAIDLHDDVTIVSREVGEVETLDDGKMKQVFVLKLVPFRTGEIELRPVTVIYTYPGPISDDAADRLAAPAVAEVSTAPTIVRVRSLLANEPSPELKPEEGPVRVYEENKLLKTALIVLIAVLVGILLGILLFRMWKRRKITPKPPPPPRPAHEIALEKLRRLAVSSMRDEERFTEFYFGVSEAFREYLGNRYDFDSLEMTTTELLDGLKKVDPVDLSIEEVREFSEDCDLVKFAKYVPTREEADAILERAFSMVEKSRITIVQPPAGGGMTVSSDAPDRGGDIGADEAGEKNVRERGAGEGHETVKAEVARVGKDSQNESAGGRPGDSSGGGDLGGER